MANTKYMTKKEKEKMFQIKNIDRGSCSSKSVDL